mmetsp:Transcript_24777/g.58535  ORF Transcript_24777/g.58535 Transcript_24777/m.58535 type:complete len:265 (-) Transcript_24777:1007-1801(-)
MTWRQRNMAPVPPGARRPPRELPEEMWDAYTLDLAVPVLHKYRDESHATFYEPMSRAEMDILIAHARGKRQGTNYPQVDNLLYSLQDQGALDFMAGETVVIMGSAFPWYEALCIALDAAKVVTIEYNKLSYEHPKIETLTITEFDAAPRRFSVALSISSFEHDGLGRYGDPLDPDGDLKAMKKMTQIVERDGVLVLAVPVGPDVVVWNLHRVYGRKRLPLLLADWTLERVEGLSPDMLEGRPTIIVDQPVFILRNRLPSKPHVF